MPAFINDGPGILETLQEAHEDGRVVFANGGNSGAFAAAFSKHEAEPSSQHKVLPALDRNAPTQISDQSKKRVGTRKT